jgi:hypothetical protein
MTGNDLIELDALHGYLAGMSAFLAEEKSRLEGLGGGELSRDEPVIVDVRRPVVEVSPDFWRLASTSSPGCHS